MSGIYADIINVSINTSDWKPVNVPSGVDSFTSIKVKARDASQFLISNASNGAKYYTSYFDTIEETVDKTPINPLFYVKGTSSTTLEVILKY